MVRVKLFALLVKIMLLGTVTACRPAVTPNAIDHIERYNSVIVRSDNPTLPVLAITLGIALIAILLGIRLAFRHNDMKTRKELLREERLAARRKTK